MVKFYYKDFNLLKCTPEADDTEIIVPKGIFMIDKNAFRGCGSIKRIVIPNGVKSLDCTFCDCVSLEELVIPSSVTFIDSKAFDGTGFLENRKEEFVSVGGILMKYNGNEENLIIPDNIRAISACVFYECNTLKSVKLPDGISEICAGTFYSCTNLETVIMPDSLIKIRLSAFEKCTSLKNVIFGRNLHNIHGAAFAGCTSLKELTIPDTVRVIEQHAFADCTSLEKVTLSENTFISRRIFHGCEKIHIYSSQTGNEITDWYNGITY